MSKGKLMSSAELRWENLTLVTKATKKAPSRTILDQASGVARPGEFLAIMGPSGAGKTTLLNCLSGKYQKTLVQTSGQVFINSHLIENVDYRSMIGFVPQDDIILESMTARESFTFSASLTLNLPFEEIEKKVNEMIDMLGLGGCADTVIGGHIIRGISGGERKRVSIGIELIFNPEVMFLDEPTTGLDSFTALTISKLLVRLTKEKNCTIVATIHQPNSQIFSSFDRLLLLVGGCSVFMDRAEHAAEFFERMGDPIPENYNPADHYMNVLSKDKFKDPAFRDNLSRQLHRKSTSLHGCTDEPLGHYKASVLFAFLVLSRRAIKETVRNPIILRVKIMKMLISAALCCMTFANLGTNFSDMQDRYGAVFMLINNCTMEALVSTVATFQTQKPVFLREYFNRKYGLGTFFTSYALSIMPIEMLYSIGLYAISYFVMGLNPDPTRFFTLMALSAMASLSGSGFGLFVSVIAPTMEIASAMAPLVFLPFMLSGGYLVSFDKIPVWFFPQYISPFRYAFESAVRTDIEHNPDINHETTKLAIDALDLPESYNDGLMYLCLIVILIRIFSGFLLDFLNRKG